MFERLNSIEIHFNSFVQNHLSFAWGDLFFIWLTTLNRSVISGIIFLCLIITLLIFRKGLRSGVVAFLLIAMSVGITDHLGFRIFKSLLNRERPFEFSSEVIAKVAAHGSSFISNHSANTMCLAVLMIYALGRRMGVFFLVLSCLVGFSRVYCGVHFVTDVLAGWLWGLVVATVSIQTFELTSKKLKKVQP